MTSATRVVDDTRTWNDGQPRAEVCQSNICDIDSVYENPTLRGFHETKKRQRQSRFAA